MSLSAALGDQDATKVVLSACCNCCVALFRLGFEVYLPRFLRHTVLSTVAPLLILSLL